MPLDVTDTLRCFRETLEKSKYHNRAIRHSRKLLSLFLAQTQGKNSCSVSLSPYFGGDAAPWTCHFLPEVPPCPADRPTHCRLRFCLAPWVTPSLSHWVPTGTPSRPSAPVPSVELPYSLCRVDPKTIFVNFLTLGIYVLTIFFASMVLVLFNFHK